VRFPRPKSPPRKRGHRRASPYNNAQGKTVRSFAAYLDLCEAAEYLTEQMSRQLAMFNLSTFQFRVLATLLHNGPQYEKAIGHQFHCSRQNVSKVVDSLVRMGCVQTSRSAIVRRIRAGVLTEAPDRRILLLRLTAKGDALIRYVFPKHAKLVKAEMKVLDGRQQETLSRLCIKLREGDALRFVKELMLLRGENRED
jgi:MarR family 2-MHQ and catechol resistance regulon transcriptional repressor